MSTIKVDTLQTTGGAGLYPAQAWLNFDQTGTLTILDDGNISSMLDRGVGLSTATFSNTRSSSSYAFIGAANDRGNDTNFGVFCIEDTYNISRSTSSVPMNTGWSIYQEKDMNRASMVVIE